MNEKLAILKQMMEEPSKEEITMVYLDEESALRCVVLPIDSEPTTDDWVKLLEKANRESWRFFEVLSVDGGRVLVDGDEFAAPVADNVLRTALALAEEKREYYFSSRRK